MAESPKPTTANDREQWPREYDVVMNPHGVSPVLTKKRMDRLVADIEHLGGEQRYTDEVLVPALATAQKEADEAHALRKTLDEVGEVVAIAGAILEDAGSPVEASVSLSLRSLLKRAIRHIEEGQNATH